jgi:hypothetical protein
MEGWDQMITGTGDLDLRNYQRHDYQNSWRVAGGGQGDTETAGCSLKNYQRHDYQKFVKI